MLSSEDRNKKVSYTNHLIQAFHERKYMFPHCSRSKEIFWECVYAFRDPQKSVVIKDEREGVNSTHICIFVNEAGAVVALPLAINESDIHIFTMKDVKKDHKNPNWFIRKYNDVGSKRGMPTLPEFIQS